MNYVLITTCIECKDVTLTSVSKRQFDKHKVPEGAIDFDKVKCIRDYCEKCQCRLSKAVPSCCAGLPLNEDGRCTICGNKL